MANILLIEDMDGVRDTLEIMLSAQGHSVTTAANGNDGLSRAKQGGFDVVITDIIMPDTDGNDVLVELRKQAKRPPTIALSGGGSKVSADDALQLARQHADQVMTKPVTQSELNDALSSVLGG